MTLAFTALAFICIDKQYFGELPWIAVMISCAWTAYGVSQGFYYNKAKKENQIKLEHIYSPDDTQPESGNDEPQEGQDGVMG